MGTGNSCGDTKQTRCYHYDVIPIMVCAKGKSGLTKRAPDWWGCAAKLVYSWLKAGSVKAVLSRPTHQRVTQAVGTPLAKRKSQ